MLIIGLGNPGRRYADTRHNVGFMFVDKIADAYKVSFKKSFTGNFEYCEIKTENDTLTLVKPLTFMNNSGSIFRTRYIRKRIINDNFVVVCDNLDLKPGRCRLKSGGSSAGHNGLKSIIAHYGKSDFKRLYVGIGRSHDGDVVNHVLGRPDDNDFNMICDSLERVYPMVLKLGKDDFQKVLNEINSAG